MILIWSAAVLAKPACDGFLVTETVPRPGAAGVPTDLRVAALLENDDCNLLDLTLRLARADDGSTVAEGVTPASDAAATGVAELAVTELDPETEYVFTVDDWTAIGFTTGDTRVEGIEGVPTFDSTAARWQPENENMRERGGTWLDWSAVPVNDPDGLSILQVADDAGRDMGAVLATTGAGTLFWPEDRDPGRVCPKVRQVDGRGVATELSEPFCVAVAHGCASSGGAGGVWGVVLAVGLGSIRVKGARSRA